MCLRLGSSRAFCPLCLVLGRKPRLSTRPQLPSCHLPRANTHRRAVCGVQFFLTFCSDVRFLPNMGIVVGVGACPIACPSWLQMFLPVKIACGNGGESEAWKAAKFRRVARDIWKIPRKRDGSVSDRACDSVCGFSCVEQVFFYLLDVLVRIHTQPCGGTH